MSDAVHTFFGLSYSNYLVLHRTLLQSMPAEWQERFVAIVMELNAAYAHIQHPPGFEVKAAESKYVGDLNDFEAAEVGVEIVLGPDDDAEAEDYHDYADEYPLYYDRNGNQLSANRDKVMVPTEDPIPPYDRGRARIEPKLPESPEAS